MAGNGSGVVSGVMTPEDCARIAEKFSDVNGYDSTTARAIADAIRKAAAERKARQ